MSACIVRSDLVSHKYAKAYAIKDISISISSNKIVGLLGANGAGKSTFMNICCGVLRQTSGDVFINGFCLRRDPKNAKRSLGFLPQQAPLHLELTVREYLTHCARLRAIDRQMERFSVDSVMEKCGVSHFANRLIGSLSGGYKQRVGIAQAIIHEPALVVLDEPTNGLDPTQILEVRGLIQEIAKSKTVILSTHMLREVEALCDRIIMFDHGEIVYDGAADRFTKQTPTTSVLISFLHPPSDEELMAIAGVQSVDRAPEGQFRIDIGSDEQTIDRLVQSSVAENWNLRELSFERVAMDEAFAQLSKR